MPLHDTLPHVFSSKLKLARTSASNGTHTLATGDIYRLLIIQARKSVCNCGVYLSNSGGDGPRNDDDHPPKYQIVMHAPLKACILHVLGRPAFGSRSEEKEKVHLAKAYPFRTTEWRGRFMP